jgi:hypothetical protein
MYISGTQFVLMLASAFLCAGVVESLVGGWAGWLLGGAIVGLPTIFYFLADRYF